MAMPPPKRIEMGHFTGFWGRRNYPQSWGARPSRKITQLYRHNVYRNSVQKRTSGSWVARKFVHNMRTAWSHRRHAQDAEGTTGTPALGLEGRAQRRIVIDDEDQGLSVHHPPSSFPRGT